MEINTTLSFNSHLIFDGIEAHVKEFILDLDYCTATEVDNVVGHAMKGIKTENEDTLRGVAQDVIDGNGFIDTDELDKRLEDYLEEDDLSWRVEDIIGDADLLDADEVHEMISARFHDENVGSLRNDLNDALDMLRCQREEMEGLQAEIAMAMNEAMIARRSVLALIDRQPLEILRNVYWSVRNSITAFKLRRKS